MNQRNKNLITYILPSVFGQICFFLFTIIDGIFVGRGVGETALGAVNLCLPFVMVVNAVYMLITIGSVSVAAIRLGRHDDSGAAAATGISQSIAFVIVLFHFILKKGELRFCKCKVNAALIKKIILRGLPEAVSQFAMPVATICMNYVLLARIGEIGENAYSVIGYVASF